MQLLSLPGEILDKIMRVEDLSPLDLLNVAQNLTRKKNRLSVAATQSTLWVSRSPDQLVAQVNRALGPDVCDRLPLMRSFEARLLAMPPEVLNAFKAYAQAPAGRNATAAVPILPEAVSGGTCFDLVLAAARAGFDTTPWMAQQFYQETSIAKALLTQKKLLAKPFFPTDILPLTQNIDAAEAYTLAPLTSDVYWRAYAPLVDLKANETGTLFARFCSRWDIKTEFMKADITHTYARIRDRSLIGPLSPWPVEDFDLQMARCSLHAGQMTFATTQQRGEPALALRAIENGSPFILRDLSESLRDDTYIVQAAVRKWGYLIIYASDRLKNDPETVRLACTSAGGHVLNYAGQRITSNVAFVCSLAHLPNPVGLFLALPQPMQYDGVVMAAFRPRFAELTAPEASELRALIVMSPVPVELFDAMTERAL